MKRVLIIPFILITSIVFSQSDCSCSEQYATPNDTVSPTRIVYDFKCKRLYKGDIEKLKKGDFYQLEVQNINLNLYKVAISYKDSTLYEEMNFSSLLAGMGDVSSLIDGIITQTKSLIIEPSDIDSSDIKINPQGIPTVEDLINGHLFITNGYKSELKEIKQSVDSLLIYVNNELKKSMSTCGSELNLDYITGFLDKQKSIIKKADEVKSKLDQSITEIEALKKEYAQQIKGKVELQNKIKELDKAISEIKAAIDQVKSSFTSEKVNKIVNQMYDVVNNSENYYRTFPLQMLKDYSEITLEISPIDSASRLPSYQTQIAFPLKHQWYLSTGPSVYGTYLNDQAFSLAGKPINDSVAEYRLVQEQSNNIEIGGAILVNGGYKWNNIFGVHGVIGAGFSFTEAVRPRLMLGAGISLGNRHNVALNYGMIAGYVNKLSNAYNLTDSYTADSQYMVSVLEAKSFISLGYVFMF